MEMPAHGEFLLPPPVPGCLGVVQSLGRVRLFATPWTVAHQAPLSSTASWRLLKFMSIASLMPSHHLILCCLLLLPSVFLNIKVFSNELVFHISWPKHWSFSFGVSPSNEYSGLISFRIDWLDLLAVQGTLKHLFHCITLPKCRAGQRWSRGPAQPQCGWSLLGCKYWEAWFTGIPETAVSHSEVVILIEIAHD